MEDVQDVFGSYKKSDDLFRFMIFITKTDQHLPHLPFYPPQPNQSIWSPTSPKGDLLFYFLASHSHETATSSSLLSFSALVTHTIDHSWKCQAPVFDT